MGRATKLRNGLTLKQERFAYEFFRNGGNATEAYRQAYPGIKASNATISRTAFDLTRNPKIVAKVEALQRELLEHQALTPARIAVNLLEDRELARELGQPAAAITADTKLGEMIGVLGTKSHLIDGTLRHEHITASLGELDPDALRVLVDLGRRLKAGEELPALPEGITEPVDEDIREEQRACMGSGSPISS